jgi:hypothetical protein
LQRGLNFEQHPEYYGELFDRRQHLTVMFLVCDEKTWPHFETFIDIRLLQNGYNPCGNREELCGSHRNSTKCTVITQVVPALHIAHPA